MSDHEDDIYGPRLGLWKGAGELVKAPDEAQGYYCLSCGFVGLAASDLYASSAGTAGPTWLHDADEQGTAACGPALPWRLRNASIDELNAYAASLKGGAEPVPEGDPPAASGGVLRRDFWSNTGTGRVLYLSGAERILSADELRRMGVTTSEAFFRVTLSGDAGRVPVLITADYLRQLKREDRRAARKRRRQARRAKGGKA